METTFTHRTWTFAGLRSTPARRRNRCHAFFIVQGQAVLSADGETQAEMIGPCVLWLPPAATGEFRLMAGSEGFSLSVEEDFVWRIAGDCQLAGPLRPLLGRILIIPAEKIAVCAAVLSTSFDALTRESREQRPGASIVTSLYLGVVLVHLWRSSGADATATLARGSGADTVQRFQQLIELHYRENLRIERFASMLGVTRAHLHHACITVARCTPLALVHSRLVEEAKLKLKETKLPVEQVGYSLGFRDPGYFHRFFKRLTGQSPAAFRQAEVAERPGAASASFADWP
jgi:AraC family transcriptional regulator, transcriptional activator of pobA